MKTKFITYAALLVISTNVYSQRTVITNDSLRVHFQNEKPHEVYIYYQKRRFNDIIDYKALYYDHELKGYLMKWLEPDTWIDYELFLRKKELYQFEPDQKESLIRYYVENNLKLKYDSIKQDTSLVNFYLNQAIEKIVYEKEKEMIKKKSNIIPDIDVLFLHARIAYPESYRIIKQWWYKQQKITSRYDGYMTNVFISLLMMNDPDAQLLFNKEIIKLSNSQWPDLFGIGINECLSYLSNAYAVQKLIEILSVTKKIVITSDGTAEPYDQLTFNLLRYLMKVNKIENNPFQSLNDLSQMRKNKDKIIEAAHQLIQKLEAEERYWMENMPFDYVPQIVK